MLLRVNHNVHSPDTLGWDAAPPVPGSAGPVPSGALPLSHLCRRAWCSIPQRGTGFPSECTIQALVSSWAPQRYWGCHPTLQGRTDDLGAAWFSLNTAPGTRPLDAPELCQSSVLSCHQNGLHSGDDKDKSRAGPASARPHRALFSSQGSPRCPRHLWAAAPAPGRQGHWCAEVPGLLPHARAAWSWGGFPSFAGPPSGTGLLPLPHSGFSLWFRTYFHFPDHI